MSRPLAGRRTTGRGGRMLSFLLSVGIIALAACGPNLNTKEKVQEAILDRLQTKSGLDLKALDVTVTSVAFDRNLAHATVAFHPKGDSRVDSGMAMTYTLEKRDGKWAVVNVGDSHGRTLRSAGPEAGSDLPPGHPAVPMDSPHSAGTQAPDAQGGVAKQ